MRVLPNARPFSCTWLPGHCRDLDHQEVDDVLDDLGERLLRTGGEVVIVPAERMPTQTGIAEIYRFG